MTNDLLNQFDFRPIAANTAVPTTNAAAATVNPAETLSFGNTADPTNDKKFPKPGSSMVTKIEQYVGRRDLVAVDRSGIVTVPEGVPHIDPTRRKPPILPQGPREVTPTKNRASHGRRGSGGGCPRFILLRSGTVGQGG